VVQHGGKLLETGTVFLGMVIAEQQFTARW
jgi:hypothetical protein